MESEQSKVANDGNETTVSGQDMTLVRIPSVVDDSVCATKADDQSNGMNQVNEDSRNMDNVVRYIYRQDVARSNESGMIGIVTEVAGDSDSDSSITDDEDDDDDDDDEDEDEDGAGDDEKEEKDGEAVANSDESPNNNRGEKTGPLSPDQVRILWINDTETTQSVNDVTVVDRGFLHGDYVSAASDPTGQVGVVVDVNITVDLLAPDGAILENVSSRDLKRVREFTVGDYVVLGPWLGRIDDVLDNVMVQFDDGSICKVMKADPLRLKPITKNLLEDGHFPYYPGQRVRASSSSIFKNSRWLSGLWKANKMEGTVTKVTVGSVFIYWIASAGFGNDSSTAPAEEQSPKNLKLLSCFSHANWQVGDWCLLPSSNLASSVPLDEGLSKLELDSSANSDLNSSHLGSFVDSDDVEQEESNENCEVLSIDPAASVEPNNANARNAESSESSSCGSSLSVAKEPIHESRPLHRKKIRKVIVRRERKNRKKEENFEKALLIINTKTKVDVAWQDGTIEHVESTKLIPVETPGDHDFVAEQYVVEKAADDENYVGEPRRVGVVKSVNAKEKTACVNWLKPVARAECPREFDKEEIVSVYELEGHPDYDYCYGDVVVRLSPVSSSSQDSIMDFGKMASPHYVTGESKSDMKMPPGSTTVENASQDECCAHYSDLSWVGNITSLKNGDIEVTWADGMVSMVGPQAIYVVGRDDDDESVAAGSEISDAASWETVEDDDVDATENDKEESGIQNASDANSSPEVEGHSGRNSALSLPLAAIGFVARLATGIFSRSRSNGDIGLDSENGSDQCQILMRNSEATYSNEEYNLEKSDILENQAVEATPITGENQVFTASVDSLDISGSFYNKPEESDRAAPNEDICCFKRFDVARDPVDHYFLGTNAQVHNGRKWFKKVQQDWNILQNNLPDGIYVRVYEDRMDLLRAVLVGAYGTPYQDGLFFFDFHLPPEYPDVPPLAYYHSGGWRINPNLYEEGKVCLSLLNTWTGRGNEVWDPSSSSILQVLVSLQGLVLNSKPYFNEAGYDKQMGTAEGEKNSLSYNENTFLLNCKTMMNLMRKPPKDFEELLKEHFKRRGYYILKACDAYMKGYLIGSLNKDASINNEDSANSTSVGFKLMLAKIAPKLLSALEEVGADCHEFKHLQQS